MFRRCVHDIKETYISKPPGIGLVKADEHAFEEIWVILRFSSIRSKAKDLYGAPEARRIANSIITCIGRDEHDCY